MNQPHLTSLITKKDLNKEIEQYKSKLVKLLNNHTKITWITAYSKGQQNEKVTEIRKIWVKNK